MFECCFGIIIVFCVLIPEVEIPPQDPGALGPHFGSSEPLGLVVPVTGWYYCISNGADRGRRNAKPGPSMQRGVPSSG